MNFDLYDESQYCDINPEATLEDSMISAIDSVRLVLNAFTQFLDENDELLIDENLLDISVGFISGDLDTLDILQIFDQSPSTITAQLESITDDGEFSSAVNFDEYTMYIHLPYTDENWCALTGQDYIVMIEYSPSENDDIQYIELLSSQSNAGNNPEKHRPSLDISYKKMTETSSWIDIITINSEGGVTSEDTPDIYYVYNDSLNTKSTILLAREMEENFNDSSFNLDEIQLEDIELSDSFFESGTYDLDITINLNEDIIDLLDSIQFLIDNVVVVGDTLDPENDNYDVSDNPDGTEGNNIFDSIDSLSLSEKYKDLGTDRCPDQYENGYEKGVQKIWWPDGRIKSNYIIKNNRRYGLLGVKNCVNVSDSIFSN